jgi:hypothetical protein
MNDVKMERVRGVTVYVARGCAFEFETTAVLFLLLVGKGDLSGAVQWKERYSL